MKNEEALFAVWFDEWRAKSWAASRAPIDDGPCPPDWSTAWRRQMLDAWMARAQADARSAELEAALRRSAGTTRGGAIDVATACQAHGGPHGRMDFGSETFVVTHE